MPSVSTFGAFSTEIPRRSVLKGGAILASLALTGFERTAAAGANLFTLGVASGDPDDRSVTLWTRLAPAPFDGGGMLPVPFLVSWRVATDERMRHVVSRGETLALPERGHAVHVRARGLEPDRWYYYQFTCLGQRSRVGRTRTFPSIHTKPGQLRFALASCQDYQAGYFAAYRHMLSQDLDFVLHVGDYIYEYGTNPAGVRQVPDGETLDLDGYRQRYALYRLDPDLQNAHAAFPFIVTFDDHEVENNYADDTSEDAVDEALFHARRAAAYQAYFEHMPLGFRSFPRNGNMRLFRRLQFGSLANLHLLDTRQYRTDQPCGDGIQPVCEDVYDPDATLTGDTQESWLFRRLNQSRARWNILAQQVMMTRWDLSAAFGAPVPFFNMDAWDGYDASRTRLLQFLHERQIQNPIVLTGDIHSAWQANLKLDFLDPNSPLVGTEFVGTSITSDFPLAYIPLVEATLSSNPHIQFFDGFHRGYMIHEVNSSEWRANYYGVQDPTNAESEVDLIAAFSVADGVPGAVAS